MRTPIQPDHTDSCARHVHSVCDCLPFCCTSLFDDLFLQDPGQLHTAVMSGLKANTEYLYSVGDGVTMSHKTTFWSAPAPNTDVDFFGNRHSNESFDARRGCSGKKVEHGGNMSLFAPPSLIAMRSCDVAALCGCECSATWAVRSRTTGASTAPSVRRATRSTRSRRTSTMALLRSTEEELSSTSVR